MLDTTLTNGGAFLMSKFTKEEKIRAVREYLEGKQGYRTIADKIVVNHAVLHNWIKQYQLHGEEAFNKPYTAYTSV